MQKLSPPGILSVQFCQNILIFRASILVKKIYQFEKLSETDFRIRLVESQNHGIQQFFFVKNRKPLVAEAIVVTSFLFRKKVSIGAW